MRRLVAFVLCLVPAIPAKTLVAQQTATVAKKQSSAVVEITTKDQTGKPLATGSGFLVRSDGVFVTNVHVIDGAASASVELSNGDVFDDVVLLDSDKRRDLAILKMKALNTPVSKLGDSDQIEVGQHVIAIGNPEGLTRSVSDGIVSAIRQGDGFRVIQTTAPISHGSSGGPLLNDSGDVIAVTFGALDGQNLNLAVPVNYVKPMLLDLDRRSQQTLMTFNAGHLKSAAAENAAPAKPAETASAAASSPSVPEKISKPIGEYLGGVLGRWSPVEAERVLGHPSAHRFAYDQNKTVDGDIYSYDDPTKFARQIELNFDSKTNLLRAIYLYPSARTTWADCKKLFGDNVQKIKGENGTKIYAYRDRALSVLLSNNDVVINFGLFPQPIAAK